MQRRPDLRDLLGMPEDADFRTYLHLIRTTAHVQWQPQVSFIRDESGETLVDRIIRYETFEQDFASVLAHLGIDASVPHVHASDRGETAGYYDDETSAMVADHYREDIAAFDYAHPTRA